MLVALSLVCRPDKPLPLSEPHFPHLKAGTLESTYGAL